MNTTTYTLCIPSSVLGTAEEILIEGPVPRIGESIFLRVENGIRVVTVQAVNHVTQLRPVKRDGRPTRYLEEIRVVAQ